MMKLTSSGICEQEIPENCVETQLVIQTKERVED